MPGDNPTRQKRNVCILHGVRLKSTRLPGKLLERIGDRRIIDIGLGFLKKVAAETRTEPLLAISVADVELIRIAKEHGIRHVETSEAAGNAVDWAGAFAGLDKKIGDLGFDWVVDSNFICHPFMSTALACAIVNRAFTAENPYCVTRLRRGIVWDEKGRCILGAGETANMKTNPQYHELAHLAYGMATNLITKEEETARRTEPAAFEQTWLDKIDIDTPDDLELARAVAKVLEASGRGFHDHD
jgi:spore coat polysaccharide biosynthesis protein SpsF (cytidylyltransferase family)